jgi:PAS domain S-box-containing protein
MSLQNIILKINDEKIKIIKLWLEDDNFKKLIDIHKLNEDIIIKRYAIAVWDYYFNCVVHKNQAGVSTLVIDFIKYLKKHELKSYELFIVYSAFKNSIIEYCYKHDYHSLEIIKDINDYFEQIFSQILNVYSKSIKDIEKALNKSVDIVDKYVLMNRCDKEGFITSVSSAFCNISGYNNYELIGKNYINILHNDENKNILEKILKTIKIDEKWQGKLKYRKKNGNYYWVQATIHPNFDNLGEIIGFDAVYQDITAQIEFEKQQSILIEQSKSAAMGEMISMIAHQWRQPLQAVSILVQKLSLLKEIDGEISDELLNEVVSQVVGQLDYMSKTIDDFRDYFKPNKRKESIYIENVVKKSIDFLDYLFRVNLVRVNYVNSSKSSLEIYLNEIVQVLINLCKNSIDAMIDKNIKERVIDIKTYEIKDQLVIELEDNAGGIKEEILNKIFEPYFSTKNDKNGTGLGLYMSKQIIQKHSNGEIYVENTVKGSKFTVKLPLN